MNCKNCHKATDMLDKNDLCRDCAEAFYPEQDYLPVRERKKVNMEKLVKV